MKISKLLTRDQLYSGSTRVEHFNVGLETYDRAMELFEMYDGDRASVNYNQETLDRLIRSNRFSDGMIVVYFNEEPVVFSCLTNYKNWSVITRYVCLKHLRLPFTSGCLIPAIKDYAKEKQRNGIAMTFNKYNLSLRDVLLGRIGKRYNTEKYDQLRDHPMFAKALEMEGEWIECERPVLYNNTKQYAAYIPFFDSKPHPFLKYEK